MKKVFTILLCVVSAFAFAACSNQPYTCDHENENTAEAPTYSALVMVTVMGVDEYAFTTEQNVYYGNVGDSLSIELLPKPTVMGQYVLFWQYDYITHMPNSEPNPAPVLITEPITISFTLTQAAHSLVIWVAAVAENYDDIFWLDGETRHGLGSELLGGDGV